MNKLFNFKQNTLKDLCLWEYFFMKLKKKVCFFLLMSIFLVASIFFPYDLYVILENDMVITSSEFDKLLNKMRDANFPDDIVDTLESNIQYMM